jgi:hypothetical protein
MARSIPSLVLFDALDARIHNDEKSIAKFLYFEYGEIRFDGYVVRKGARDMQTNVTKGTVKPGASKSVNYEIEAVKVKDHVSIKIRSEIETIEITVALPDSARWAYIGLTGEHCQLSDVRIDRDEQSVSDNYIERIAEEISYIDVPSGDIPNVQTDGYRLESTAGIPIKDKLMLSFHTMSLPTARLIWHCPFFCIYTSDDGKVNGPNYHEYSLTRLDGENWAAGDYSTNKTTLVYTQEFTNWDAWKDINKAGLDVNAVLERNGNQVTLKTKNVGIDITNVTYVNESPEKIYVALTGDQCAITNIRFKEE